MKNFLIRLAIFTSLVFVIDRGIGYSLSYLSKNTTGGFVGHHNYIMSETTDDILIFGSSRAAHHYNAQLIQDTLGVTCYNCGQDGEGLILSYGRWQCLKQRYHPKLIIWDVNVSTDIMKDDNSQYLGWLKGFYDNDSIKQIFEEVDHTEKYRMQSYLYRYNSRFHQILIDYFHPVHNLSRGYQPKHLVFDTLKIKERFSYSPEITVDPLKYKFMNNFINDMDSAKIVFVVSPTWWDGIQDEYLTIIQELVIDNECLFWDFSSDTAFVHHNDLFYDCYHMNSCGADKFTSALIKKLREEKVLDY